MPIEDRVNLLTIGLLGLGAIVLFSALQRGTPRFSSGYADIPPPSPLPLPPPLGDPFTSESPCGCGA